MNTLQEQLSYYDNDGIPRVLEGCTLSVDRAGRYWLWSEQLQHNLAHKIKTREACLLAAINSLLFTVELRDERIAELKRIADLALRFADEIKPDEE